jgi:hypothetical protein
MILDFLFQFTLAAGDAMPNAATTTSGNVVDIGIGLQAAANPSGLAIPGVAAGAGARDLGVGDKPAMKILVEVTTAGAGTSIQVNLQGAPDSGTGTEGAYTTYVSGPVITAANAIVGSRLLEVDLPRPPAGAPLPRYLRLQYVAVGNMSAGVMKAWAVLDRFDQPGSQSGILSGYVPGITIPN